MDLSAFGDPWEHIRLLSDAPRNRALIDLLARHAPGQRVLEVGCGTGLLSVIAAKLGARQVYAVEPTPLIEIARQLVRDNQLQDVVELLSGTVESLEPRPADLVFSELLNADPFAERVVPAMRAAARWLTPGGRLAPRRLRVWTALVYAPESAAESRAAREQIAAIEGRFGLDLGLLSEVLSPDEPYKYVSTVSEIISTPALAWDLPLGADEEPDDEVEVDVIVERSGPMAGAVVWFEAELDDGVVMANPPGDGGHWGQVISSFAEERAVRAGETITLCLSLDDDEVTITA